MASNVYDIFPAVNSDYQFPPEIRNALLLSSDVQAAIDARSDQKITDRLQPFINARQYQNYRWANAVARAAQVGMRALDKGYQTDTGVEYIFNNGAWQVYGSDPSIVTPFINTRQYQNYRWANATARSAQTGMRMYDRGVQMDTGVEYQYNGSSWDNYISAATPSTDASKLISGILANARLDYGVVQAFRNDRSVDAPVNGDGINGDWNKVFQPGVYRIYSGNTNTNAPSGAYLFGTLLVVGAGTGISSRTQMYFAHTGAAWYRTAWNGSDWGTWRYIASSPDIDNLRSSLQTQIDDRYTKAQINATDAALDARLDSLENSATPSFTPASGWTTNRANFWRSGRTLQLDLSVKRTGGAIASGNITNLLIGTVPGGFGCAGYAAISSGPGGDVSAFYVQGTGIYIAATTATISNNDEVTCGGNWIMS